MRKVTAPVPTHAHRVTGRTGRSFAASAIATLTSARFRLPAAAASLAIGMVAGCDPAGPAPGVGSAGGDSAPAAAVEELLRREVARIDSAATSLDAIFQPLPLLTPGEEETLRASSNARQLESARALGVARGLPADRLAVLEREGRLVRLADSEYWVIRDLDHSQPLVVPAVVALLARVGERFQARLAELGLPRFRMEITSVLRTADDQEALRRVNPNAALGESTHEYGTTIDVLYSAFASPVEPIVPMHTGEEEWAEPFLRRYADLSAERVAARRSLEMKAILGRVLIELQREGRVLVTLERQQPVFHMTSTGDR